MAINKDNYLQINATLQKAGVTLVAVSKTKPVEDILVLYNLGQRDFGENYVQELVEKSRELPNDIRWHFIGHLQTNKVKLIAPFVQLIHGVDSLKLLKEINKEAGKNKRVIDCLLQCHIAQEETKFGLDGEELNTIIEELDKSPMLDVRVIGLMGMASFTEDKKKVRKEFHTLKELYEKYLAQQGSNLKWRILSMGMSGDYQIAIEEGSTMVRIGSLFFGERARKQ